MTPTTLWFVVSLRKDAETKIEELTDIIEIEVSQAYVGKSVIREAAIEAEKEAKRLAALRLQCRVDELFLVAKQRLTYLPETPEDLYGLLCPGKYTQHSLGGQLSHNHI